MKKITSSIEPISKIAPILPTRKLNRDTNVNVESTLCVFREFEELTEKEKDTVKNFLSSFLHKEKGIKYKNLIPSDLYLDYVYFIKNGDLVDLKRKIVKSIDRKV